MPHIKHIKVEHFRALKSVEFSLNNLAVLIGENDVGKTSVLNAIRVFYAHKKLNNEHDFHQHDKTKPVIITVTLEADEEVVIRKTFEYDKTPKAERIENGEASAASQELLNQYASKESFYFFPVNRDAAVQFAMGKTALLGKLVRDCVRTRIEQDDVRDSLSILEEKVAEAVEEPRTALERYLREQMHNDTLNLSFHDLEVDLVDGVSLTPGLSDDRVESLPFANRGAGTQNNLVIALFRYLAEKQTTQNLIIALEEPENSLHPKAQRQLLSVLMDLSERNQIICTTHSPVFIERTKFESNILITRRGDGRADAKVFSSDALAQVQGELGIRPADALLKGGGNCALIVEGFTEEEAMPDFFESSGKSEFQLGISIINANGCDFQKISRICLLLKAFNIPAVVMLDADAQNYADDLKRAKENGELNNLEEVFVLSRGTIEDYFPTSVIREVLNTDFSPSSEITEEDLADDLKGKKLLSQIKRMMHERNCGKDIDFFKRTLGLRGGKIMLRDGIPLDNEIKEVINKVAEVASNY